RAGSQRPRSTPRGRRRESCCARRDGQLRAGAGRPPRRRRRGRRGDRLARGGGRVTGAANEVAARGADLVVLAVKADGALETARAVAAALGSTPLLSVASAIEVRKGVGALPDADVRSLAERIQDVVDAPVVA